MPRSEVLGLAEAGALCVPPVLAVGAPTLALSDGVQDVLGVGVAVPSDVALAQREAKAVVETVGELVAVSVGVGRGEPVGEPQAEGVGMADGESCAPPERVAAEVSEAEGDALGVAAAVAVAAGDRVVLAVA